MFRALFKSCLPVTACLLSVFPATAAASAESLQVASNGRPVASIVVPSGVPVPYAATELKKYLRALSGADLEIITDTQIANRPAGEAVILLGGPDTNKAVHEAVAAKWVSFTDLKPEGLILQSGRLGGHPALVVGGNDEMATMYAAYELVERLGVTFLLTASDHADLIPAPNQNLSIPSLAVRMEPAFPRRGFMFPIVFDHMTAFSYEDYARVIDQMAKLKCNYLQIWWFAYQPWLKYTYKGETKWMGDVATKESGYLGWALNGFGSHTTDDVSIGKEDFKNYRIAPPELQHVETPDQAFDIAQNMLQRVIHHAKLRGIKVWPAIEMASLPPNLARYSDPVGTLPFHYIFGTFVHPLDPVNREIQAIRLKALVDTYPEAEGYFLVFAELYPKLDLPKYRAFFEEKRPEFFELRKTRWPWIAWGGSDLAFLDSNIGYYDLFQYMLKKRDEIAPNVKLGLMGIGRGYALPVFDKKLPANIPFTDLESGGVWTPAGVPMKVFGDMGNRERTIEPRVDDDNNMMGMQFSVRLYSARDRVFADGPKYGLSGFAGQVDRSRGMETNSRYLAEAGWNPSLTAEQFYESYSRRLFGEAAAPDMYRAFMALEDNEEHLGYYNYGYSTMNCCGPLPEVDQAYKYSKQPNPFGGPIGWESFISSSADTIQRFQGSVKLLDAALGHMRDASPKAAVQGQYELRYLMNRTESYRDYIQSLIIMRQAYVTFYDAFDSKDHIPRKEFETRLDKSMGEFDSGIAMAQVATRKYAELVDETSDLGVLYQMNSRALLGFDLARQWMRNVVAFQEGKPYVQTVRFDRLYKEEVTTEQR
jgi:Glycosyl hydrolase family 67 N-terminus